VQSSSKKYHHQQTNTQIFFTDLMPFQANIQCMQYLHKKVYFEFVDLEKAFEKLPCKVIC